jgi:anti-anti-sigma factor
MSISWADRRDSPKLRRRTPSGGGEAAPDAGAPVPPSSTCRVVAESQVGTAVFRLQGEIDSITARDVRTLLDGAIGEAAVVLDLSEVSVIDTAGMMALREVIQCIAAQGGQIAVICPWRTAKSVRGLVGTHGFVYLAKSTSGALGWLAELAISGGSGIERGAISA